ncbi:response regulator transcription factor [Candidatus Sumerlaeota bacterium]|nr:response regulator transcription factor [Candidatus Sumerlaeota bacterium]
MKRITVMLADDHGAVRKGIRALLDVEGKVEVVAEALTCCQAVEMAAKFCPAVVLMDIAMPKLNGIEAARQILKSAPATRILMLSAHDDDAYIDQAMALGASGYLLKQGSGEMLITAIMEAEKGNPFFSPTILKRLRDRKGKPGGAAGFLKRKKGAKVRAGRRRAV